jgi:hypothetical protein
MDFVRVFVKTSGSFPEFYGPRGSFVSNLSSRMTSLNGIFQHTYDYQHGCQVSAQVGPLDVGTDTL